jgi:cell division septum initiation protein DivIVA
MTLYDRTDHADDPAPPALTPTEAALAHIKRQLAQLTARLVEEARADNDRLTKLERDNAQLREQLQNLSARVRRGK